MGKSGKKSSVASPPSDGDDNSNIGGLTATPITLTNNQFKKLFSALTSSTSAPPTTPAPGIAGAAAADPAPTDSTITRPRTDWLVDLTSKRGSTLFKDATTLPPGLQQLSATVAKAEDIFTRIENVGREHGWRQHLDIPTAGTGAVLAAVSTPGGETLHHFDLSETKDMLKKLPELEESAVIQYAVFYNGDLNQQLCLRTDGKLIISRLNLTDTDQDRLLASQHKFRLRVVSNVIWGTLESNLTPQSLETLLVDKDKFTFVCAETNTPQYDGLIALYLLLKKVKPTTVVSVGTLRLKLESLTLKKYGYDVSRLITAAQDIRQKMISEFGEHSCDDSLFLTNLLTALATGNNKDFNDEVRSHERAWTMQKPGYTDPAVITSHLLTLYNNMVHKKTWGKTLPPEDHSKLVALTTQLDTLREKLAAQDKQLKSLKSSTGGGDKKGGGGGGGKPGPWRTVKVGETTTDPTTGKTVKWCKLHGKEGCYMPMDHDHEAWAAAKKSKQKQPSKRDRDTPTDHSKSVTFRTEKDTPKKLRLNQKLRTALVTGAYISSSELEDLEASIAEMDDSENMSSKE